VTTFNAQIPRDQAQKYGLEAVEIIRNGCYTSSAGRKIELDAAIERAVQSTIAYPPEAAFTLHRHGGYTTQVEVENETTLSAARRLLAQGLNPVALNFASATHPGGGFLSGARAQEEYLARSSTLYACLQNQAMYGFHQRQQDALYTSYMLYSPAVSIFRADNGELLEEPYSVGIITAAAPYAKHMPPHRHSEILHVFRERIAKVLWIGLEHGHDAIVLGAWGCGAFGNDGNVVSKLFQEQISQNFPGAYQRIIFAIVDWSDEKQFIRPFEEVFSGAEKGKRDE